MLQQNVFNEAKLMKLNFCENEHRSKTHRLITQIEAKIQRSSHHLVYSKLTSMKKIQCFVSYHIFAVWDSIKLLKSLQNKMSIALTKEYSAYPSELKRLINKIVFAQTSDLYPYGQPNDNFAIYLRAIAEMEINPDYFLWDFLEAPDNLDSLKPGIKELVEFNLAIVRTGTTAEIMAAFFCGREKLNSTLFTSGIEILKREGKECSILANYLARLLLENNFQSELISLELINYICQDEAESVRALQTGLEALNLKQQLWNYAMTEIIEINS